jgi:alkanesulfonate monooxygenase SsuD/methylene tetrahydromethanopterin reductase-like flavin-dependent oxidoreductase (luciferase family)
LEETLEIIRLLWKSDGFVDYDGDHFDLDDAHLYTKFDEPPETHVAASGPSTVKLTSEYGDGFITVKTGEEFIERLYPAVRSYTEDEGRDPDEMETTVLVIVSYDPDYEAVIELTRSWWATTQNVFDRALSNPKEIEEVGEQATREEIEKKFLIADDPTTITEQLEAYADMGFDRIALGNMSPEPEQLFDVMCDEVMPSL